MTMVKINGVTYEFEELSEEVKNHLKFLAFIDAELEQLAMRRSVLLISREQIGHRLDKTMVHQSIQQSAQASDAPTDGAQAL
jgi:hypothetical protein